MLRQFIRRAVLLAIVLVALACAAPQAVSSPASGGPSTQPTTTTASSAPKRVTLGVSFEPASFYYALVPASVRGSSGSLSELAAPGITTFDNPGALHPVFADQVPSTDNGLWQVQSDGEMTTTWHLKPGSQWQDGTPLTTDDLRFTLEAVSDPDLPVFHDKSYDLISEVDTPDPQTVTLHWTQPYIQADWIFTYMLAQPMPAHLLADAYASNKAGFTDLPYWTDGFVGIGPFKLDQWVHGSYLTMQANDQYVLGRPKLDEIQVQFINDTNTLVTTLMAGSLDVVFQAVSIDQALLLRQQWQDGKVDIAPDGWIVVYPQFVNADPPIVTNLEFRKALMYAVDREALAATLMNGVTPAADSVLTGTPEYEATESSIVHYPYDVQRAAQMIEDLGYQKGSDGTYRDSTGQPLHFETRTSEFREIQSRTLFPLVSYWQQLGLTVDTYVIPAERANDLQEQATYPGLQELRQPNGLVRMTSLVSSQARMPETGYTGTNNGRFMNPDFDALIDRYLVTIPNDQRTEVIGEAVHFISDQLPVMGLFYDASASLVANRVLGISPNTGAEEGRMAWNAQDWDVQ